jgi:hypothetical protein
MENPHKGDKVLHRNGCVGEVVSLSSRVTFRGLTTTYNIKFLEGSQPGVNCLREEFTFPVTGTSRAQ